MEISIVMVVIGLVVGSILTGQSLIRTATLQKQIRQIREYEQAFNTFITKYNCVPGDCPNITSILGTTDALGNTINNGDGSGVIDTGSGASYDVTPTPTWTSSIEMQGAIQQLAAAQLISFVPTNPSSHAFGVSIPATVLNPNAEFFLGASYNFISSTRIVPITSYQTGNNALWFFVCHAIPLPDTIKLWDDNCGVFKAADLQAIDQKIDDGMPFTGRLFGYGGYGTTYNNCVNSNGLSSTYNTTYTDNECDAAYILN